MGFFNAEYLPSNETHNDVNYTANASKISKDVYEAERIPRNSEEPKKKRTLQYSNNDQTNDE